MSDKTSSDIENEFIGILLSALKKGMMTEEFFAVADETLNHLRGKTSNETVEKIIKGAASSEEVKAMIEKLQNKE